MRDKRGRGGGMAVWHTSREAGGKTFGSTLHEHISHGSAAHTQTDTCSAKVKSHSEVWVIWLSCKATAYADLTPG